MFSGSFVLLQTFNKTEELLQGCAYVVLTLNCFTRESGRAQSVSQLATCWKVRWSNPYVGENFRTRPDQTLGPPILLYNVYRFSFPEGKAAGTWRWPSTPI